MKTPAAEAVMSLRFTPLVIALYAVVSVVGAVISFSSARGPLAAMTAITVVATLSAVLVLLIASRIPSFSKVGKPAASGVIFIVVAIVTGCLRGLIVVQLSALWEIELISGSTAQVINSTVSAVLWLTLAAVLVGSRDRYRRRYRALLLRGNVELDWDKHPNVQQVKVNVAEALGSPALASGPDLEMVAAAIRREIDTNIRPLSHRLWFGTEDEEPRVRLSGLLRDALALWSVPTWSVLTIWFLAALLGSTRWLGGEVALLAALFSTVILAAVIVAVGRITPESAVIRGSALAVGSVISIVGADFSLRALGYSSRVFEDFPLVFVLPVTVAALVVTAAAISLAESDRGLVLQVAAQESQAIAELRRQSTYLHNSLQSELTGLAMQLDQAAASGSSEETRAALERVHALLARSISEDFASFRENPRERIGRIVDGWRGICQVTIDTPDEALDDPRAGVAVQAIEEVIANAVRHAGASRIDIRVICGPGGLDVSCRSDGMSSTTAGAGLGSRVLSAAAPRGVTVEPNAEGTSVRFSIS